MARLFALCPAFAGMTEGGQGGGWIRYRGSGLLFVSRFRGNDRFVCGGGKEIAASVFGLLAMT